MPAGWKERLIAIRNENTGGGTGLCLEIHDLAVSKLVAAREKDLDFTGALLRNRLANPEVIEERLTSTPLTEDRRRACVARLERLKRSQLGNKTDKTS